MNIVSIVDEELRLCSNLDEYSFGKTNYDSIVSQEAYIFDGKNFAVWNFEEVKSFNTEGKTERIVFYCGKNPLSSKAKTLLEYFEEGGEALYKAVYAVCEALTSAAKNGNNISLVGAGGILVDLSTADTKVLFLPEDLFKYSVNGLSKEDVYNQNGGWINETLHGMPAFCFERAVILYRLISGKMPFTAIDTVERNSDILDQKFLPLELTVNGIDSRFAYIINKALKLNSNAINIPGKKQKGKSSEDLTPTADFPLEQLEENYKNAQNNKINDTELAEKAAAYIKMQDSKITAKRKFRRNSATYGVLAVVALVLAFFIYDTVNARQSEATSKGLTSTQVIQAFLYSTNTKQNTIMSNLVKGKQPQRTIDAISQVYVIDKQRKTYEKDNGFAYPENWLLYATDEMKYNRSGVYGVTNVKIDGTPVDLDVKIYQRNENPQPIIQEGNITLENGLESVHKVQYYLIHTEGEENGFIVEEITEIYTLTYLKDRWFITEISTDSKVLPVKNSTFKNDYFNQLVIDNGDAIAAVENLRGKYKWLPSKKAMQAEKELIEYKILHPFDDLGF